MTSLRSLVLASALVLALPAVSLAASVSIQNVSPSTSVSAKSAITFTVVPSGITPPIFQLTDSFSGSSAGSSNIAPSGIFTWTPGSSDVGAHTFTITVSDAGGDIASTTEQITVNGAPALSIISVNPGTTVMAGTKLSFTASQTGFTSPTFIVGDSFNGSTVSDSNIDSSGNFSWTPDQTQNGTHTITVYAQDSQGHSANVTETVQVGAGATLTAGAVSPSATISPGQTATFNVTGSNYSPTSFTLSDSFPNSSLTNGNINVSGNFSWSPTASDAGVHHITITGQVGAYGQSATTSVAISVLGPNGVVPGATTSANTTTTSTATTTSSNASQLSALETQLQALQAQLASKTGGSSASTGFTFTSHLQVGSQGDEVTALQALLAQQGFFSGTPTGYFGPATESAVAAFQSAHGLEALGSVGPGTRAALNALSGGSSSSTTGTTSTTTPSDTSTGTGTSNSYSSNLYVFQNPINPGDSGTDVVELQIRLASLGFLQAWPTGTYGPATTAAVASFQSAHGIAAKGYVGPATIAALNQAGE